MGADFHAYVIVGVRVERADLYETKRVKAFIHNHPEDWSVDPKTGRQLWRDEDVFLLEDAGVTDDDYEWRRGKKGGAKAVLIFDQEGDDSGTNGFIGRHLIELHVGHDKPTSIKGVNMLDEKKFLEDLLTPHRLWKEKEFGIWLVGSVSA